MAIKKTLIEPITGVEVKCWDIDSVYFKASTGVSTMLVNGWFNAEAKAAGKAPAMVKGFEIPFDTNPELAAQTGQFLMQFVLSQPEFADSVVE